MWCKSSMFTAVDECVSIVAIIFESLSMQSSVFKALCSHCADDTWIG